MPPPETKRHQLLKTLALAWAQASGFAICAPEVRVPRSGYRVDVAAYAPQGRGQTAARTAICECKQARADLLKDAQEEAASRARRAERTERRRNLEGLRAVHRPDLRRGEALWPEFDTWDFSSPEHRAHRGVLDELERVQCRVLRGTKFSKRFRYRCADVLHLVVEGDIFAEAEIPAGWGLLVRRGETLELARPPAQLATTAEQRVALLENIALAATRRGRRQFSTTDEHG